MESYRTQFAFEPTCILPHAMRNKSSTRFMNHIIDNLNVTAFYISYVYYSTVVVYDKALHHTARMQEVFKLTIRISCTYANSLFFASIVKCALYISAIRQRVSRQTMALSILSQTSISIAGVSALLAFQTVIRYRN